MRYVRTGLASLAITLILAPGIGQAASFCIKGFPNPSWLLVGKGFTVPAKGVCKPWTGFNPANGSNDPTNGVGCTSSDGSNLSLNVTTSDEPLGFVEIDSISLSLPSKTGAVVGQDIGSNSVSSYTASGITGAACSNNTIPAVATESVATPALTGAGTAPPGH